MTFGLPLLSTEAQTTRLNVYNTRALNATSLPFFQLVIAHLNDGAVVVIILYVLFIFVRVNVILRG